MSEDQKNSSREKQEKGGPINIQVHDSFHVTDAKSPRLRLIREYIKKNPWFLALFIALNVINCLLGFFLIGWVSFFVAAILNVVLVFVGLQAIIKIREEKG